MVNRLAEVEAQAPVAKKARKAPAKPRRKKKTKAEVAAELYAFKQRLAVSLGVAIPVFSMCLCHIGGSLVSEVLWVAAFFGIVAVSVLVLSLSHLAEAVEDTTGARPWQAWLMAVALDCTIVACELCHVFASDEQLWYWSTALMGAAGIFSAVLNVYAFTKHVK